MHQSGTVSPHVRKLSRRRTAVEGRDDSLAVVDYTLRIMTSWIVTGVVFARVRQMTAARLPWTPELAAPDAAEELAGITVAVALRHLESSTNSWSPQGGGSFHTYFLGQCLLRFPNEYRRWLREHRAGSAPATEALDEAVDVPDPRPLHDPEQVVLSRSDLASALPGTAGARDRRALLLHANGHSHAAIAVELGTSPKAVEMLLYRLRRSARQNRSWS
ncbi:DNA-directed RNA polymerase specialized sigma subunit, sigma24 family [Actinopolyspora xinjiangensis]|uniref:DNA-directed RNA polymerase specialized sigma subunit, sigma24 family n=1 Tax=Actinopolyspora xinjiangensis TaxID=405564 RepID=A0A1H0X1M6_9ACTN|nr:sigma factor-like helix-turn-helix DNA-binding protein [Actinopolyspora xinjiangensis]SDP96853.1 DNA-directed RNA polymerase specialized sigma subunit, sigma24 family [Actinopolyspora xinjiangensis]